MTTRGEKVCQFIERYCLIPEGSKVGQPIKLLDFQRKFVLDVYDNPTGKEPLAFAGAMLEYTFNMCPECMEEFSAQNQVYTGGGVTPLYNMLCKDVSITSIEDVAGLRLRAGGAGFVRFADHFRAQQSCDYDTV